MSNPERLSVFADKLSAKKYVSSLGLDVYIPETLYSCSRIDKLKLNEFKGSSFVIKTSHGGGGKFIDVFCEKDNFDERKLEDKYNKLIKIKTGEKIDELFYDVIVPSIFIEENLNSLVEGELVDYKFHVFNGEVRFVQLNHRASMHDYTMTILNRDFNKLPFTLDRTLKSLSEDELYKPVLFEKAIYLAEVIAKDFNYLRVDFYLTDNEVIFGEMTLCPSSGYSKVSPREWDDKIGSYWDIEKELF